MPHARHCPLPHARRCPLPSPAARPGGGRARRLDRLSRRPAPHGRRPRPGPRRRHRDGQRVGPGRDRRRRPGWGARPPDLPPRVDTGVVAAATLRPPPSESRRLARRSRQGRAPRGRPRARGGRGGLRAPPRDAPLVALGGGRVPRRERGARLRLPRVDRPALLPTHAARRPGAARAAPHPGAPAFGLAGASDPAGMPWLALVLLALSLVALPLGNAFSRWVERQADDFALATTGNPGAFIAAMERLAELNLAERRPSRLKELVLYSHPALDRRIARARGGLA